MKKQQVVLLCAVLLGLVGGCQDDDPAAPGGQVPPGQVSDFALQDVNPTSATFDRDVSPRDHLRQVSAWYFGHAT